VLETYDFISFFQRILNEEADEDGGDKNSEQKETKTKEQLAEEERQRML